MNDRPEFLDRLKEDLGAGVPGFRGKQRRRRIIASAVGGLALLAGVVTVVASGGDEPRDSVSAVGDVPEVPAYEQSQERLSISVSTGTVRDLTDTVGDVGDEGAPPVGTPLGGPLNLVANGSTPGGAVQACPAGATSGSGEADFFGDLLPVDADDDLIAFVGQHISDTYPADAPVRTSSPYVVTDAEDRRATVAVLAPWSSENDALVGAWFGVVKTAEFGLAISSDWGCTPFLWGYGDDTGSIAPTGAATTLSSSELDRLLAGLRVGLTDYAVGRTPTELRNFVDIAVRGTVVAVHQGRTFRSLLEPSGLNDETFATLEIEGAEFASTGSVGDESRFYIEIQMGDLLGDQLQVLVGTEVVAFGIDTSDVNLGEQWAIDNPLAGRPGAGQPIFTVHPQGLLLVTEQSVVGVYDELPAGWSPVQNFATGTEAADWVIAEAEK